MSEDNLNGKVAVITGASKGLGKAMALALGGAGASIALASRDIEQLNGVKQAVEDMGGKAQVFQADDARQGIRTILGQPDSISWVELSRQYRKYLFAKGSSKSANKPPAFDLASAQLVVEQQNGELPLPQRLLCRIRYFTDGVILGSQGFVESPFNRLKQKLGYRRHKAATRLTALGSPGLWVFRELRVRAVP
jgi:short chain dehydrogenase